MSLPKFDVQGSLFESLGPIATNLFSDQDIYRLFATKIWPLLAKSREELAAEFGWPAWAGRAKTPR
jgi:hypothetical protein